MRELTIAIAVLVRGDMYLLQFRDGAAAIGGTGLTGCFGGKIELGEDAARAICRELSEETSLSGLEPKAFRYIGKFTVESDHKPEPVLVHAEVFELRLIPDQTVEAREGQLKAMTLQELLAAKESLTPATRAYFEQLEIEAA